MKSNKELDLIKYEVVRNILKINISKILNVFNNRQTKNKLTTFYKINFYSKIKQIINANSIPDKVSNYMKTIFKFYKNKEQKIILSSLKKWKNETLMESRINFLKNSLEKQITNIFKKENEILLLHLKEKESELGRLNSILIEKIKIEDELKSKKQFFEEKEINQFVKIRNLSVSCDLETSTDPKIKFDSSKITNPKTNNKTKKNVSNLLKEINEIIGVNENKYKNKLESKKEFKSKPLLNTKEPITSKRIRRSSSNKFIKVVKDFQQKTCTKKEFKNLNSYQTEDTLSSKPLLSMRPVCPESKSKQNSNNFTSSLSQLRNSLTKSMTLTSFTKSKKALNLK